MSSSTRLPTSIIVASVLIAAGYAAQADLRIGLAVALVGLAAAHFGGVLGIPAGVGMAVASLHAPGVVAAIIVVAAVIAPFLLLGAFALKFPALAQARANGAGLGTRLG